MRWSQVFIPTLRDDPAGAEAISHKLLMRGGFIRQLMSGSYSLLPAGFRVHTKIRRIIEEESWATNCFVSRTAAVSTTSSG